MYLRMELLKSKRQIYIIDDALHFEFQVIYLFVLFSIKINKFTEIFVFCSENREWQRLNLEDNKRNKHFRNDKKKTIKTNV